MKTKIEITVLSINSQQGFFLRDSIIPVAAYSHHNKVVYFSIPYTSSMFNIPENYKEYTIVDQHTDSFSIHMWTKKGDLHV